MRHHERPAEPGWRFRLHEIVFEADTRGGKLFDVLLLTAIVTSVAAVMLESVPSLRARHGAVLLGVEWCFTLLFSVEYLVRLASVRYPSRHARSFFGVVDLLAVVPTYLSLFLPGSQALLVVRVLRMIRVFRVLKLAHYLAGGEEIVQALRASRPKISAAPFGDRVVHHAVHAVIAPLFERGFVDYNLRQPGDIGGHSTVFSTCRRAG